MKQGDVLAQVDPRIDRARLDEAEGRPAADQAQAADVQTSLGRNEPLLEDGYATDIHRPESRGTCRVRGVVSRGHPRTRPATTASC